MFNKKDYMSSLNKARRKRNQNPYVTYLFYGLAGIAAVMVLAAVMVFARKQATAFSEWRTERAQQQAEADAAAQALEELESQKESESAAEAEAAKADLAEKQAVVDAYGNIGIVHVSGYLNVRKTPESGGDIIGKMQENSVCTILDEQDGWYHIQSGEVEGYISSEYVLSGDEAKTEALEQVSLRAVITADSLNIRTSPEIKDDNVVGQALEGERYQVIGQGDGWIQISSGYISADYAEVKLSLNEAVKMDLRAMAINRYDHLVISKVTNYLNVRSSPADEGDKNIIGKMPSKAAGDILETLDGWYKIRSGSITGYITADPQYTATGQEAIDLATQAASLMAIVRTDRLNVRMEPNTDSKIWTQISKEERYPVEKQLDGWVQIDLDTGDSGNGEENDGAYISTRDNNVDVQYALTEAIKFSPMEETANQQASLRSKIVNYALKFVGNPYVWGGTSLTNGADCSGFTQSVLRNFGISVPRVSREQANTGKGIKSSDMRPGDLIFYTNSKGTINHVAMYIGNGQIVHAASRRSGIKISTWNYRTPAKIRNVID
jgi:cell wall-associated NlpC family hydrolase